MQTNPSNILNSLREHAVHFRHEAVKPVFCARRVVTPIQENLARETSCPVEHLPGPTRKEDYGKLTCGHVARACFLRLRRKGASLCKSTTILPSYSTNQCQVPCRIARLTATFTRSPASKPLTRAPFISQRGGVNFLEMTAWTEAGMMTNALILEAGWQ